MCWQVLYLIIQKTKRRECVDRHFVTMWAQNGDDKWAGYLICDIKYSILNLLIDFFCSVDKCLQKSRNTHALMALHMYKCMCDDYVPLPHWQLFLLMFP